MYLFIAHKPDSVDYCRGCVMASYNGDFVIHNHLDKDRVVEYLADYLFKNEFLRCGESGYVIYVFQDGFKIIEDSKSSWDGWEANIEDWEIADREAAAYKECDELLNAARVKVDQRKLEKKQKEDRQAEIEKHKREQEEKAQRHLQWQALNKEFANK